MENEDWEKCFFGGGERNQIKENDKMKSVRGR